MSKEETVEQKQFIAALLQTKPVQYVHQYLVAKGRAPKVRNGPYSRRNIH